MKLSSNLHVQADKPGYMYSQCLRLVTLVHVCVLYADGRNAFVSMRTLCVSVVRRCVCSYK